MAPYVNKDVYTQIFRLNILRTIAASITSNIYVEQGEHTNGEMIAVKVLHHIPGLDDDQFEKEYHNLASLEHENIVRLVGYCHETQREFLPHNGKVVLTELTHRALCFEFMQNGSLASFLTGIMHGFVLVLGNTTLKNHS
jgi:hypothetical protein